MLNVYLASSKETEIEYYIEDFFRYNRGVIDFSHPLIRGAMSDIDGVEFLGEDLVRSTMTGEVRNVTYLSIGCKTAICAIACEDTIFIADTCGDNVFSYLSKVGKGNIYIPEYMPLPTFNGFVNIVGDVKQQKSLTPLEVKARKTNANYKGYAPTITDKITLSGDKITFDLNLKSNCTLIGGDSGTGKSYLYILAVNAIRADESLPYMFLSDSYSSIVFDTVHNYRDKLFFIDTVERVLTPEQRYYVSHDPNNQYILFVHDTTGFDPMFSWYTELQIFDNKGFLGR
jgi:hypothetical protein